MSFLCTISKPLATKFALKLFFTPLKFSTPKRELNSRECAIQHKLSTTKSKFTLFEWPGPGPKVILVHGWSGRATQFFKIVESLKKNGYHTFAIEAPAHGESSQKKTHMLEFVDCMEVAQQGYGPFDLAIGHSLGGMAIFNAMKRNLSSSKVIVIGTPSNIRNVVQDFCDKVHASSAVGNSIIRNIESRYSLKVEDASTDTLANIYNPTGLIIHDKHDQDISDSNAMDLAKSWSRAELMLTEGLGHRKVLMDNEVIKKIIHFLSGE